MAHSEGHNRFGAELTFAVQMARRAIMAAERIRKGHFGTAFKEDGTPLTQADLVSQALILSGLERHFPRDRVLAEEEWGRGDGADMEEATTALLKEMDARWDAGRIGDAVNYRGNPRGNRVWMIDPIDGTKGFRAGLCYAVAIGLYAEGTAQLGCMAVPPFPGCAAGASEMPTIAYAAKGLGAHEVGLRDPAPRKLVVSPSRRLSEFRVVGSRAHDERDLCSRFTRRAKMPAAQRVDGQAKYLMLAAGRAEIYIREANPAFGIGYPWDHCAGQVILEEAGGRVTDFAGGMLRYEPDSRLIMDGIEGLVATNASCHQAVLDMVQAVMRNHHSGDG
jgi:3'(2'), 5'-bisphosphate nucleotidase